MGLYVSMSLKGFYLWIDKKTLMIRKIKWVLNDGEINYFYDIVEMDSVINDSTFQLPEL